MNPQNNDAAEETQDGDVFINDSDIIHEIPIDEEDLPDVDEEQGSEAEALDEPDDSVHIFTGHTDEVHSVACSPTDATLVATGGMDDKGFLWKIGEGDWAFELQGHQDTIISLSFSPDGQLLASGSYDNSVKVWDVPMRQLKCSFDDVGASIEWVKWHPRGHLVLAGSEDFTVWMWNADTGLFLNMFSGHEGKVTCGDFTPDGKSICTASDDASLRIWNPRTREAQVVRGHPYHTRGIICLAISADSTLAITGSVDGSVHVVNIVTGRVVSSLAAHSDSVESVAFSRRGPWAATGSVDQKLIIWDLQHNTPRCTCEHEYGVTCLEWVGISRFIASGCVDGRVRIWDGLSGVCVRTFSGHSEPVQSLSITANGEYLVSVSQDGTARAFEIGEFK